MRLTGATSPNRSMTVNSRKAMSQGMRTLLTFILVGAALLVGRPAEAQNVSTTGQIRGRIVDQQGQAVSQVVVMARNLDTGLERTALSNNDGLYALRLLPPGDYTVSTQVIGFADEALEPVTVAIGQSASANFVLETQAIEVEGLEVVADRARIDASDGSVTQLVTVDQIEELPSLGRDFVDFIELSGLVAPDPGETTGGQFAIGGQRPSGTNVQIDGVDANNSFFGENRGGSRIPFVFSLESIEQFQIITNGFDVEYGNYSGGIVNVVTRGGTNDFEGTVYGNFRSDALTGSNFLTGDEVGDYEVQQVAARLSGPIVEDQAHFLVSFDGQRRREPQLPLTLGQLDPQDDAQVIEDLERYWQILEEGYGIANPASGYQPFETTNDALTLFGRVDWSLNDDHRLTLRHNFSTFTNDNEFNDLFDYEYGVSRAEEFEDRSHSLVGELQSLLGDNTFNVLRFQWADEDRPRQGHDVRPTLSVRIPNIPVNSGLVRYGGTFAAFNNLLEETKIQLIDNFTHIVGDHTIKIGGNFLRTSVLNQFQNPGSRSQGAGEFRFESLDDFADFRPSSYYRPFQQGGGISRAEFDVVEWSAYIQDEWQVTPKLTATVGLRYDQQSFQDSPTPVVDVERAFGFQTGFAPTDQDNVSPRLALAYDVEGDGNHVVRAGAGYFYGRVPYVLGGNVFQTEVPGVEIFCSGALGDPNAPPDVSEWQDWAQDGSENPIQCAGEGGLADPVPSYSLWTDDFQYPEVFKANLGYEGLLGERARVSVDLLFTEGTNQYNLRNINLRPAQFEIAGEGRRAFTPLDVFDPSQEDDLNARINTEFADVYATYNDGRNRAYTLNLEGSYAFSENYRLTGSYTFTRAYDNISVSCCTASSLFEDPLIGAFGPNDLGGAGAFDKAWGRSDYSRDHTFIVSGFTRLPYDIEVSAFWRVQSGRPWTPAVSGDLNGDGVEFNDRPFVFSPDNLPLAATGDAAAEQRARYAGFLSEHDCVGDYEGQMIRRNTCEFPWTNRLDMKLTKVFETFAGQRAELQLDLFNVTNGIGQLFCDRPDEDDPDFATFEGTEGTCGWGRVTGIFSADTNLLEVAGFDPETRQILYGVPEEDEFFAESVLGSNLLLQFQAQIGFRYYF